MMQELNYIRCGDYYIPDIRLPEETRPIGRWGRMHRDYIKESLDNVNLGFIVFIASCMGIGTVGGAVGIGPAIILITPKPNITNK